MNLKEVKTGRRVVCIDDTDWVEKGSTGTLLDDLCYSPNVKWDSEVMLKKPRKDLIWCVGIHKLQLEKRSFIDRVIEFLTRILH